MPSYRRIWVTPPHDHLKPPASRECPLEKGEGGVGCGAEARSGLESLGPANMTAIISAWKSMPTVQSHREVSAAPARQCFSQESDRDQRDVAENGCKLASTAQALWHVTYGL